ncbi:MAG: hypothetical protein OER86_11715, partial [Phycisphaerae bacterium]|nr:hypothetical protein [Phycisphaerae bacterium]
FADTSLQKVKDYLREQGLSLEKERRAKPAAEQIRAGLRDRRTGLTPKEREILKLRYGLNGNVAMTLEEAGRVFDLTRERVRQIQKHAEQKIMARLLFK